MQRVINIIGTWILVSGLAWGAISANTIWEVRPTNGVDTNGGGFVSGAAGTDFSQQNAKNTAGNNISTTDAVGVGTTTITSATGSFTSAIVGNIIYLQGGTGTLAAGWYQAVTFTNSTTIVLDRSVAAGTGITMNIGGALKTLTQLNTNFTPGNFGWVKAESIISTASTITFNMTQPGANQFSTIAGYTSSRGDNGQVEILASTNVQPIVNVNSVGLYVANFLIVGNGGGTSAGIWFTSQATRGTNISVQNTGTNQTALRLDAQNIHILNSSVTNAGSGGTAFQITSNTFGTSVLINDVSYANAVDGFSQSGATGTLMIGCISAGNTGNGFTITANQAPVSLISNLAYANTVDGFHLTSGNWGAIVMLSNISWGNGGHGINYASGTMIEPLPKFSYNAYGGNTGSNISGILAGAHDVTLTADPTVAGASNNFALNNTAGGGAAVRNAGFPGALVAGGAGSAAIGPLQAASSGAHGSAIIQ